jgi:hypothetical protein
MNKLASLIATSALLAGALWVAGCGSSATASHSAPRVVIVPDHPQRTIALRAVQLASINVPDLSWLSFYQGSVWVNAGNGFNTRIDAQTNKPTGRIGKFTPGGAGNYCQGLGAGGGAVWSCLKTGVTRIDPTRMRIAATFPIGKAFDQGKLVFMDGRIWVITGPTGNQLVGIDTTTNKPGPPITLPFGCDDLAGGGTSLWVVCPRANRVVKVDVAHRSIQGTLALAQTYEGAATATDLWVGSSQGLVRVNATTLKPEAIFQHLDPGQIGDVAVDGDHVWVRTTDGSLRLIDARSNTIVEQITVPPRLRGGALLIAAGSIWTTADDAGLLLRLRAAS